MIRVQPFMFNIATLFLDPSKKFNHQPYYEVERAVEALKWRLTQPHVPSASRVE